MSAVTDAIEAEQPRRMCTVCHALSQLDAKDQAAIRAANLNAAALARVLEAAGYPVTDSPARRHLQKRHP